MAADPIPARSGRTTLRAASAAKLEGCQRAPGKRFTASREQAGWSPAPDPSCRPAPADASAPDSSDYLGESTEQSGPIVRVTVANGGSQMRSAAKVAGLLIPFAQDREQHVASIIGLDRTLTSTREAIRAFGDAGIVTIATTLSGDKLTELSDSYFQLVPQDTREALIAVRYAAWTGRSQLDVYFPNRDCSGSNIAPDNDDYVHDLVSDVQTEADVISVHGQPLQTSAHGWTPASCHPSDGDLQANLVREHRLSRHLQGSGADARRCVLRERPTRQDHGIRTFPVSAGR